MTYVCNLEEHKNCMDMSEKERAKDLMNVSVFSENMAVELLGITATEYNAALLLKARDNRGKPLLDVLIENEQKEVVSYASVQRYLTEIWTARVDWSFGKTVAFCLFVLICPPAWFYFSLPLESRIGRAPIIKFVCHIVSHIYFTFLLTIVVLTVPFFHPIPTKDCHPSLSPHQNEAFSVRMCTQKAQMDLRHEENIDAFSMGDGQPGRAEDAMREDASNVHGASSGEGGELGPSADWSIESVIDWKRIVSMYYQINGIRDKEAKEEE